MANLFTPYRRQFGKRTAMLLLPFVLSFALLLLPDYHLSAQSADQTKLYVPPQLDVRPVDGMGMLWKYIERRGPYRERKDSVIRIYESSARYELELLPIVFFDRGSSFLPKRYQVLSSRTEADRYHETDPIEVTFRRYEPEFKYYEILNILGDRMRRFPETTLQIEGGYTAESGESVELGRERGETIQHYLHDIWQIDIARITLLPPRLLVSSTKNRLANEEGRRVTLLSSDPQLFAPLHYVLQKLQYQPVGLLFTIDSRMPAGEVSRMTAVISIGEEIVSRTNLPVSADSTIYHLTTLWALPRLPDLIEDPIEIQVIVERVNGEVRLSNRSSVRAVVASSTQNLFPDQIWPEKNPFRIYYEDYEFFAPVNVYTGSSSSSSLTRFYEASFMYDAGTTVIQPWKRMQFNSLVGDIYEDVMRMNSDQGEGVMTFTLYSSVDLGDLSTLDMTEIDAITGNAADYRLRLPDLLKEGGIEIPLFIFQDFNPPYRTDWQSMGNELNRTFFGPSYGDLAWVQRDPVPHIDLTDEAVIELAGLSRSRSSRIEQELRQHLPAELIDTIIIDSVSATPSSLPFYLLPEQRLYDQLISVSVIAEKYEPIDEEYDLFDTEEK